MLDRRRSLLVGAGVLIAIVAVALTNRLGDVQGQLAACEQSAARVYPRKSVTDLGAFAENYVADYIENCMVAAGYRPDTNLPICSTGTDYRSQTACYKRANLWERLTGQ